MTPRPKRSLPAALLLAFLLLPSAALAARQKVAVMDLKVLKGLSEGTAAILSEIVTTEIAKVQGLEVVSRSEVAAMLDYDRQRQLLDCEENSSCLAEIGGALGVEYMVTGQMGTIGSRNRLSLILVDVRKAKVVARAARFCEANEDALVEASQLAVHELVGAIGLGGDQPVAASPEPSPAPTVRAEASSGSGRTPAWLTLGGGAALLAGGGVFALLTKSGYDDLKSKEGTLEYPDYYNRNADTVRRNALLADVLAGAGVIAVGVGAVLLLTSDDPAPAVVLAPAAGPGTLGLSLSGNL